MGDPETQVVFPRIKNDLAEMLYATAVGKLDEVELLVEKKSATTVVVVSRGYPEAYKKGKIINGLPSSTSSTVFQAGTTNNEGEILTNGGRVIAVTSLGDNHKKALKKSYNLLDKISFEGMYYRKDIGFDL